jgi:hypothetical protein
MGLSGQRGVAGRLSPPQFLHGLRSFSQKKYAKTIDIQEDVFYIL